MTDFQERVVTEKEKLGTKIEALAKFKEGKVYKTLPEQDRIDLTKQLRLMRGYFQVLVSRISRFVTEVKEGEVEVEPLSQLELASQLFASDTPAEFKSDNEEEE